MGGLFAVVVRIICGQEQTTMGMTTLTDMETKLDPIAGLLILLLVATLAAFFTGIFPYPYGWLIIASLLVFRVLGSQRR